MQVFKKILLALGILLGVVLTAAIVLFVYLTVTEYRPAEQEALAVEQPVNSALNRTTFTVLSWNIGYCGLGEESDFFMDGGQMVRPDSEDWVTKNLAGVQGYLSARDPDFILLQEVDSDSRRSYGVDQVSTLSGGLRRSSAFALNFSAKFLPYPWPPLGKVNSGLLTLSSWKVSEASRISLPCPFSWPMSMVNLKRCLLVERVPLEGSDRELVLVNLHLEAYDEGEGKLAQSRQLREFLAAEYEKGNYVVAGGDWNQLFPGTEALYPNTHEELWTPGFLDEAELTAGWQYVWDDSVPTCRLLNQPYDPADTANTQYYVIDGFLISPNLRVEDVETLDGHFAFSDHNPVQLTLTMGE